MRWDSNGERGKRKIQRRGEGETMGLEGGWKRQEGRESCKGGERGQKMSFFFIQSRIILKNCRDKGSSKD